MGARAQKTCRNKKAAKEETILIYSDRLGIELKTQKLMRPAKQEKPYMSLREHRDAITTALDTYLLAYRTVSTGNDIPIHRMKQDDKHAMYVEPV